MDYTTLLRVKTAMDSKETTADADLLDYITRASRVIDNLCVGVPGGQNYFGTETIVDELLTNGLIDSYGVLRVYPHKPAIQTVSAFSYRFGLTRPWSDVDLARVAPEGGPLVVYEGNLCYSERVYARISYTGGLGLTVDDLPADLVDIATLMAIRLYKEERSGLGDSIGVAELGGMVYTKAIPERVRVVLAAYTRIEPWM